MMKVALGQSEDVDSAKVVREVLGQLTPSLAGIMPQAGIMFCGVNLDHALILSAIRTAFPGIELIGCTTDGGLTSAFGFSEDALMLMVFASDTIEIRAGVGREVSRLGEAAGRLAATTAWASLSRYHNQARFAVILSDPMNAGVLEIDKGMEGVLGATFPIIGAAAAAHSKRKETYQFYNGEVLTDSVVLLLFAGAVVFSCGIKGGHAPMGGKARVTSSQRNVIYQIDNEPALNYFRRYIGKNVTLFMNYCLAVYEAGRESFYVRSAPYCDTQIGSVTLNGKVPEGSLVQIGTADKETMIPSCTESLHRALDTYPGSKPAAALLFSCAARKMIMGTKVIEESETVRRHLGAIPFCGFYSYGEFGPPEKGEKSLFHGATFVTLLFGPAEEDKPII
jgi:hypothetical protein